MLSKICPKCSSVQKLSEYLSVLVIFTNYSLHAGCSPTHQCTERNVDGSIVQWIVLSKPIYVKKCFNFAISNCLSKNCPRKYWLTKRSPNRTLDFFGGPNFWTPICTSIDSFRGMSEVLQFCTTARLPWTESDRWTCSVEMTQALYCIVYCAVSSLAQNILLYVLSHRHCNSPFHYQLGKETLCDSMWWNLTGIRGLRQVLETSLVLFCSHSHLTLLVCVHWSI